MIGKVSSQAFSIVVSYRKLSEILTEHGRPFADSLSLPASSISPLMLGPEI